MAKVIFQDNFLLMGTNYHEKEANKVMAEIGKKSPYWDKDKDFISDYIKSNFKDIYKYYRVSTKDVEIVREPLNRHDPNAIKVMVNKTFVGYFPADLAKRLIPYVKKSSHYQMEATLTGRGGQYKTLKNDLKTVVTKKKDITYKLRLTILKVDRVSKSKNTGLSESIASWFLN